ncbi:hypothetical protein NW762_007969 [Fusarium torreyae]|uniref:Sulfatase N-terminal domain-containing protein n=1 Tax=Fusarium torreyae TaxID=1237075 RepID=A0A9W8VFU2_9HYPO|nr:hypothetical protein NW762_007969 [Fusarium torreyae]
MTSPNSNKNVLLLIADDLGKYLGCYGCNSVKTPNIDHLAAKGTLFDYAFASTASCSGSRSTIYTGLHTHENGQYGLLQSFFTTHKHIDSNITLFNNAGFLTGLVAKCHVGPPEVYPWHVREETQKNQPRDVAWMADRCEAFMERAKQEGKPFFLTAAFHDPHRDLTRGGFGNDIGPLDKRIKDIQVNTEDVEPPSWLTDCPGLREELAQYYRSIHRMDQGVGFILDRLAQQGFADDTLVIFLSDNGPPFVNAKTTLYDAGICLPMIIRCPGHKGGITSPQLVSFLDVLPTALEWAGLPLDYRVSEKSPLRRGRSLLRILDEGRILNDDEWDQFVFCSHTYHQIQHHYPTRVIRTRKYKYHRNVLWQVPFPFPLDLYGSLSYEDMRNMDTNPVMIGERTLRDYLYRQPEQLYDLEDDPQEVKDLASDPKYGDVVKGMRRLVEKWQYETQDLWLWRDGQSIYNAQRNGRTDIPLPDRFDPDPENPSVKEGKGYDIITTGIRFE